MNEGFAVILALLAGSCSVRFSSAGLGGRFGEEFGRNSRPFCFSGSLVLRTAVARGWLLFRLPNNWRRSLGASSDLWSRVSL